jgi:Flp pilus assembly protein TadG
LETELLLHCVEEGEFMAKCLQKETSTRVCGGFLRRLASDKRGQELVEFALIFPALIMLLLGIFYFARAMSVYQAIGRAAREGARVALAPTCASCGNASNIAAGYTAIDNALTAASLNSGAAGKNIMPILLDSSDPTNFQVNGVTVTVTYPIRFPIPFDRALSRRRFRLTSIVTMRQEF